MPDDQQQIRDVIATWLRASTKGDLATVLKLMSEDVVFLIPGQAPMRGRSAFAQAFQNGAQRFRMEASSEILEIEVNGDLAYCWTRLSVTAIPLQTGQTRYRSGHTLSILRKQADGNWVLVRDANLLADVAAPA
jgi:uncharacterized protein (TIGR02246 family)